MKSFIDLVSVRYSCRAYADREVPAAELDYILEAARLAPSACNRQPWRFVVVEKGDVDGRKAVIDSYNREWIASAPMFIIVCGVPSEGWVRRYDEHSHIDVDTSIATEHICLAAADRGLGTCWVCNFEPAVLRAGLGLDETLVPIAIIPLGYPADDAKVPAKQRKTIDEIVIRR